MREGETKPVFNYICTDGRITGHSLVAALIAKLIRQTYFKNFQQLHFALEAIRSGNPI